MPLISDVMDDEEDLIAEQQRAQARPARNTETDAENSENYSSDQEPTGAGGSADPNQATPEEQEAYEKVVLAASEILYSPKTSAPILQQLKAEAANPAQAIAGVATMLMVELDQKAKGTIPETVILPAAMEVAELVAELGSEAKLFKVDQKTLNQAGQMVVAALAEQYGVGEAEIQELMGRFSEEEIEAYRAEQEGGAAPAQPDETRQNPTQPDAESDAEEMPEDDY